MSPEEDFRSDRRELDKEFRGLRRSPIRRVNKARKAKRFEEAFGGAAYVEHLHSLECAICGALCEWTVAAHVRSRGAGGKADALVPLCASRFGILGCHEKFDARDPETRKHEPRLRSLAKRLRRAFLEQQDTEDDAA